MMLCLPETAYRRVFAFQKGTTDLGEGCTKTVPAP